MRNYLNVVVSAAVLVLIIVGFNLPAHAEDYKGLFVHWRGETPAGKGFKEGLKALDVNFSAETFDAEKDKQKLLDYLDTVDETKFDFIYGFGTTINLELSKRFKNTPIFFAVVTSPVKAGLIKSWESSGNNVTGVSHSIPIKDEYSFITKIGNFKKIGVCYDPGQVNSVIVLKELTAMGKEDQIEFVGYPVEKEDRIAANVDKMVNEKVDLVYLPSDSFVVSHADQFITPLNERKVPTYGAVEKYIRTAKP